MSFERECTDRVVRIDSDVVDWIKVLAGQRIHELAIPKEVHAALAVALHYKFARFEFPYFSITPTGKDFLNVPERWREFMV